MKRGAWKWPVLLIVVGVVICASIGQPGASWIRTGENQSPVPNVDFPIMAIATEAFEALEAGGTAKVPVKAWERCALGAPSCGAYPAVEAICMGSGRTVLIGAARWTALERIPAEDLPGVTNAPRDMRLCDDASAAKTGAPSKSGSTDQAPISDRPSAIVRRARGPSRRQAATAAPLV